MKKLPYLALILLLTLLVSGGAVAQEEPPNLTEEPKSLTLEQAIQLALENNYQVRLNELNVEKAKLQLEQVKYQAKKIDKQFVRTYDIALAKYVLPMSTELQVVVAEAQARLSDDLLKLKVEKNYYDLIKAQAALKNAQKALERAQEQLRIAQVSFKAGALAQSEVIGAEVLVASKEAQVLTAQNNYEKARAALAESLGLPLDTQLVPTSEFTFEPLEVDLAAELERAKENDLELIAARGSIPIAEETFNQAKGFYTPNVFMYREAEYQLEEAKVKAKQREAALELNVHQAYLDLKSAEQAYRTLEKTLATAQETYRVTKLKFEAGAATRLEVEQAAGALEEQENKVMEMLYTYNLAAAQFRYGLFLDTSGASTMGGISTPVPSSNAAGSMDAGGEM